MAVPRAPLSPVWSVCPFECSRWGPLTTTYTSCEMHPALPGGMRGRGAQCSSGPCVPHPRAKGHGRWARLSLSLTDGRRRRCPADHKAFLQRLRRLAPAEVKIQSVRLETLSIRQQVHMLATTDVLLAPSGGGLWGMLYVPKVRGVSRCVRMPPDGEGRAAGPSSQPSLCVVERGYWNGKGPKAGVPGLVGKAVGEGWQPVLCLVAG